MSQHNPTPTPYVFDKLAKAVSRAFNCRTEYRIDGAAIVMWPVSYVVNPEIDLRKLRQAFDEDVIILIAAFRRNPKICVEAYGKLEGESVFVDLYLEPQSSS